MTIKSELFYTVSGDCFKCYNTDAFGIFRLC